MTSHYVYSKVGKYHLDAGSDVCQDAVEIINIEKNVLIAAVADGVGSEDHSEFASQAAVHACCQYCKDYYAQLDPSVLLNNAFYVAKFAIQDVSIEKNIPLSQLHCTLCTVLITQDKIYCGNVGDSGAIGLTTDGNYILLTKPQNDEEGRVYPLSEEYSWAFSQYDYKFSGIILATDGFYNYLFPPYLPDAMNDDFNYSRQYLDIDRISEYIDLNVIQRDIGEKDLQEYFTDKIDQIPRNNSYDGIIDDLSVIGILISECSNSECRIQINRELLVQQYMEIVNKKLYLKDQDNSGDQSSDDSTSSASGDTDSGNDDAMQVVLSQDFLDSAEINYHKQDLTSYKLNDSKSYVKFESNFLTNNQDYVDKLNSLMRLKSDSNKNIIGWPSKLVFDAAVCQGYISDQECSGSPIVDYYNGPVQLRLGIAYALSKNIDSLNKLGIHLDLFSDIDTFFDESNAQITFSQSDIISIRMNEEDSGERFHLGIIILKLIFNGCEPSLLNSSSDDVCKYRKDDLPNLDCFPPSLQRLFIRMCCEECVQFPEAVEWIKAINPGDYVKCGINPTHIFYREAPKCPYCTFNSKMMKFNLSGN